MPRRVEVDHARERREPAVVARDVRLFVERVDREDEADEVQDVDRPVTDRVVRDVRIAAARVPDGHRQASSRRFAITMRWIWFVPS